jgi:transcriptional regulator with XRE-family HTH domain
MEETRKKMDGPGLKDALGELKWTQAALARYLGVAPNTVISWTKGRTPIPKGIVEWVTVLLFVARQIETVRTGGKNTVN